MDAEVSARNYHMRHAELVEPLAWGPRANHSNEYPEFAIEGLNRRLASFGRGQADAEARSD